MSWDIDCSSLNDILPLKGNVITATYRDLPLKGGLTKPLRVCLAMGLARKGRIINIDGPSNLCSGDYICGFDPGPRIDNLQRLVGHNHQSMLIAKLAAESRPSVPYNFAKYLVLAPLEKTNFTPDLVIFTCLPSQAFDLMRISNYDSISAPTGVIYAQLCRSGITNPLLSGNIEIGLTCHAAIRHAKYKPEEMIVSMPVKWFATTVRNCNELRIVGHSD